MKRGFIRGLWGIYDTSNRIVARRSKIDVNIDTIKNCKFNEPFKVYVFGKDNYNAIRNLGFDAVLINDSPFIYDLVEYQYRHKLELIKHAMEVDGYDEMVYLDWDCIPQKKLPNDFWDKCYLKEPFQACLQTYRRPKCAWRPVDSRKVPNGGFLYIRDKEFPSKAIKIWETETKQANDELAYAKAVDGMIGGWNDSDKCMKIYWDKYETNYCNLVRGSSYPREMTATKDVHFIHYI